MQTNGFHFWNAAKDQFYVFALRLRSEVLEDLQYIPVYIYAMGSDDLDHRIFRDFIEGLHEFPFIQETYIQRQFDDKMPGDAFRVFAQGKACPVSMFYQEVNGKCQPDG